MDYRKEISAIESGLSVSMPVGFKNKLVDAMELDSIDGQAKMFVKATNDDLSLVIGGERKLFELSVASDVALNGEQAFISPFSITVAEEGKDKQDTNIVKKTGESFGLEVSHDDPLLNLALKARQEVVSTKIKEMPSSDDLWDYDEDFSNQNPDDAIKVGMGDDSLVTSVDVMVSRSSELEIVSDYFDKQYPSLNKQKTQDILNLIENADVNANKMLKILSKYSGEAQANIVFFGLKKTPAELNKFIHKNYQRMFEPKENNKETGLTR